MMIKKKSVNFFVATTKNNKSENLARISGSLHVDAHKKNFTKNFFRLISEDLYYDLQVPTFWAVFSQKR